MGGSTQTNPGEGSNPTVMVDQPPAVAHPIGSVSNAQPHPCITAIGRENEKGIRTAEQREKMSNDQLLFVPLDCINYPTKTRPIGAYAPINIFEKLQINPSVLVSKITRPSAEHNSPVQPLRAEELHVHGRRSREQRLVSRSCWPSPPPRSPPWWH